MPDAIAHKHFNKAKSQLKKIKLPVHEHPSTYRAPISRFDGIWLEADGVHFIRRRATIGRLLHEAAHYALVAPCDRPRIIPGCLRDLGIQSCGEDPACEAWAGALAQSAGIPLEPLFTDFEDYQFAAPKKATPEDVAFAIALNILTKEHPGIVLLKVMDMTDGYPRMKKWLADEDTARRQADLVEQCGTLTDFGYW